MKNTFTTLTAIALTLTSQLHAKGGGGNGFLDAAAKYEQKAKQAKADGKHEGARIYKRMAQIKRDAAAGRLKNWDEYHALSKKLNDAMGWNKGKKQQRKNKGVKKYVDKSTKHTNKSDKQPKQKGKETKPAKKISAEKGAKLAQQYEKQAKVHKQQSDLALQDGDTRTANIHNRLAQFLVTASIKAQRGTKPNLEAYYKAQRELFEANEAPKGVQGNEDDVENW